MTSMIAVHIISRSTYYDIHLLKYNIMTDHHKWFIASLAFLHNLISTGVGTIYPCRTNHEFRLFGYLLHLNSPLKGEVSEHLDVQSVSEMLVLPSNGAACGLVSWNPVCSHQGALEVLKQHSKWRRL